MIKYSHLKTFIFTTATTPIKLYLFTVLRIKKKGYSFPPSSLKTPTHSCILKEEAAVHIHPPEIPMSHLNHPAGPQPRLRYLFLPVSWPTAVPRSWLLFLGSVCRQICWSAWRWGWCEPVGHRSGALQSVGKGGIMAHHRQYTIKMRICSCFLNIENWWIPCLNRFRLNWCLLIVSQFPSQHNVCSFYCLFLRVSFISPCTNSCFYHAVCWSFHTQKKQPRPNGFQESSELKAPTQCHCSRAPDRRQVSRAVLPVKQRVQQSSIRGNE